MRYLFLQALRQVASLPDLHRNLALRRVDLETMKGLRELAPLATAPGIEEISLVDMGHLQPHDLQPLVGLRSLRRIGMGLGSLRKNAQARAMFGLPDVEGRFDWRT